MIVLEKLKTLSWSGIPSCKFVHLSNHCLTKLWLTPRCTWDPRSCMESFEWLHTDRPRDCGGHHNSKTRGVHRYSSPLLWRLHDGVDCSRLGQQDWGHVKLRDAQLQVDKDWRLSHTAWSRAIQQSADVDNANSHTVCMDHAPPSQCLRARN